MEMKYDRDGSAYRTEELPDSACLVYPQIVTTFGNPCNGPLCILDKSVLSDNPPQVVDGEVAEAKAVLADLNEQIETARGTLTATERAAAERMARLKQHPFLKHLDDFLAGRLTHFVEYDYYSPPRILTWDDAKTRQHKLKLLTLFGDTDGDLAWKQNEYTDETGFTHTVIPCVSRDEALGEAAKLFATHETDAMNPEHSTTPSRQWVDQAEKYGLWMTAAYIRALEEMEARAKQAKIAKLRSEIQKWEEVT